MSDSQDSDSDSADEYETLRRRNIAEKERMFAELGLNNAIEATKEVFRKNVEHEKSGEKEGRRKSYRKSTKCSELLPMRRSVRIEKKFHRCKYVRGFKGFSDVSSSSINAISSTKDSDTLGENDTTTTIIQPEGEHLNNIISSSDDEPGLEANERKSSTVKGITVRFPWHQKLFSEISSKCDNKKNESTFNGELQNSNELSEFEANERLVLTNIIKYSAMIKSHENHCPFSDSESDYDDDWDLYNKVEFFVSTSEDESESYSDSDSFANRGVKKEKGRKPRTKVVHRSSAASIPCISPDEVTESIIRNIAKRGSNKIYDPVNGTTCHQCRQKTSDSKTVCRSGRCSGVRGMFCGVCLSNRYGESVEDALRNPDWECPVCRGVCNCSFCRARAGKMPTGILYPVVKSHGYKNVAEFLKQCDKENYSDESNKKKRKKIVGSRGEV